MGVKEAAPESKPGVRRLPTDFCFACDPKLCASGMTPRPRTTFAIHLFLRSIVCFLFGLVSVWSAFCFVYTDALLWVVHSVLLRLCRRTEW